VNNKAFSNILIVGLGELGLPAISLILADLSILCIDAYV